MQPSDDRDEDRDWDDPCDCPRDTFPWPTCARCRFTTAVEMAGGLSAYRAEEEHQRMLDAGFMPWEC